MRKARARGQIWPAFGNTDKPSPGPEPLSRVKRTERQATGTGHEDAGSDQEFGGASGHCCALENPSTCCTGILPPGALAWKIQESGQPSPPLTRFRDAQEATDMPWRREERRWWRKGRPVAAHPLREGPPALALSQLRFPGHSPGGPDVLRPLKPLVVSPQETWLCVCEWLTHLCPPTRPFLRHRETGQGPGAHPGGREKRSVLYMVVI